MTGPNSGPGPQLAAGLRRGPDRLRGQRDHHDPARTTCATSMSARTCSGATTGGIQKRLTKTTWMSGCSSWYLTEGRLQRLDVPGLRHPVSSSDAGLPIRRLRRRRARRTPCLRSRRRPEMSAARQPRQPAGPISTILGGSAPRAPADPQGLPRRHRDGGVAAVRRGRPTARRRGVRRVPHRGTGPAGGHHHPQHPGLPRPRPAASAAAGGPDRAVQRHPSDAAAADHLAARPRLQHRPRARDVVARGSRARTSATCSGWRPRSRAAGPPRSPNG